MSELLNKILTNQELTSSEVESICHPWSPHMDFHLRIVDEFYSGLKRRWSIPSEVIFSVLDANDNERYFSLEYEEGLTENQEDSFFEQIAVEVERKNVQVQVWEKKPVKLEE